MALLRCLIGLWLLGVRSMTLLQAVGGPNSVGAFLFWHFCACEMAPCDWLREALLLWHCCICALASPVEHLPYSISAMS